MSWSQMNGLKRLVSLDVQNLLKLKEAKYILCKILVSDSLLGNVNYFR